jgi:hypothetical protein
MNTRSGTYSLSAVSPVWWFVASFSAILAFIALLNYKNFPFRSLNLFTILWISACLVTAHVLVNMKTYVRLYTAGNWREISASIRSDMFHYLPYLLMAMLYDNINLFNDPVRVKVENFDYYFMMADEFLFNAQPTIVLEKYLNPYLVEFFMASYTLFVLPYAFLMYLFQKREHAIFDKLLLAQVIASMIALACFIYLPALGPRYVLDPANTQRLGTPPAV